MTFMDFASSHGLIIDRLIEGVWARVKTTDHPKKRNGTYKLLGEVGFVQNHATMGSVAVWRADGRSERVDRAAMRQILRESQEAERRRNEAAATLAEGMVKRSSVETHFYLASKGFPEETGLVLDGELLIPMREFSLYRQINSIQRIKPDGSKLFLTGGKAKGSVFFLGPYMAKERWLCEGYATGLSVRAALRYLHRDAQVVVCFSAGNLAHIGKIVKTLRCPAFVMADHDESGAGERAAKETGLLWTMPPKVGEDANDMHLLHGLTALTKLIREAR